MADKRADLSGKPEDFEQISGTAKLERKKVVLGGNRAAEEGPEADPDDVQTQELRARPQASVPESTAAEEDSVGTQDLSSQRPGTERVIKQGTERVVKKKITLGQPGAVAPAAAGSKKSDSQRMLRPKSLAGMTDEEKIQTQELLPQEMDPSRRRETDTANLKRIRPGKTSAEGVTAGGETGTDTIHLRVIKEKKNQLKNILSASQTIRLRPSPSDTQSSRPQQQPAPAPAAPSTTTDEEETEALQQKRTLKIKAPSVETVAEAAPTGEIQRPKTEKTSKPGTAPLKRTQESPAAPEAPTDPRTAMVSRDKLKQTVVPTQLKRSAESEVVKKPGEVSTDTVKLKAPVKKELEAAPAASEGPKSTLKIKSPAQTAVGSTVVTPPATEAQAPTTDTTPVPVVSKTSPGGKGTLKIKAPTGAETQAAPTPPVAAPGAQTIKQAAPAEATTAAAAAGGKTLKLKAAPKAQTMKTPAPAVKAEAATAVAAAAEASPEAAAEPVRQAAVGRPGVVYTLIAAASFAAGGAAVALMAMQYLKIF